MQAIDVLPVMQDKKQTEAKHGHDVSRQRQQEQEEVAVVPLADTVVHPWTVMVKLLNGKVKTCLSERGCEKHLSVRLTTYSHTKCLFLPFLLVDELEANGGFTVSGVIQQTESGDGGQTAAAAVVP